MIDDKNYPVYPQNYFDRHWFSPDSRENYEKLLKIKPDDWIYRNKSVEYHWNELGYRSPSFENINWEESILLFGDSQMLGVGLDESECLRTLIAQQTKKQVVSLAVSGSSALFHWANSIKLKKWLGDINPLAIIIMWPTWERFFLGEYNSITHVGAWTKYNWIAHFLENQNIEIYNNASRDSFLNIWKNTFVIECKTKPNDPWNVPSRVNDLIIDRARDGQHLGPKWALDQSKHWIEILKKANVI